MAAPTSPAPSQVPGTVLTSGRHNSKHSFTDVADIQFSVFQSATQTSMPGLPDSTSTDTQSTTSTDDLSAAVVDLTDLNDIHSGVTEGDEESQWPSSTNSAETWSASELSLWKPKQYWDEVQYMGAWSAGADVTAQAAYFAEQDAALSGVPCIFGDNSWSMPTHFSNAWPGANPGHFQQAEQWDELWHEAPAYQKPWGKSATSRRDPVQLHPLLLAQPPGLETSLETTAKPALRPAQWLDEGAAAAGPVGKSALPKVSRHFLKTRPCGFFGVGRCTRGDQCLYAHTTVELREPPDLTKTKMCPTFASGGRCQVAGCRFAHTYDELRGTDGVYKTHLCRWWSQGFCKAGANCRFAHGDEELQHTTSSSD